MAEACQINFLDVLNLEQEGGVESIAADAGEKLSRPQLADDELAFAAGILFRTKRLLGDEPPDLPVVRYDGMCGAYFLGTANPALQRVEHVFHAVVDVVDGERRAVEVKLHQDFDAVGRGVGDIALFLRLNDGLLNSAAPFEARRFICRYADRDGLSFLRHAANCLPKCPYG